MNVDERNRAVQDFQTQPHRQVFLLSLKAAGVGYNISSDLWQHGGNRDVCMWFFTCVCTDGYVRDLWLRRLNLTAANHVIHYDLWWNPAVENQATDRAFRIGQTKNVFVVPFHPSLLPSIHPSFLPSFFLSFFPSFRPSFLPSFHRSFHLSLFRMWQPKPTIIQFSSAASYTYTPPLTQTYSMTPTYSYTNIHSHAYYTHTHSAFTTAVNEL